MPRVPVSENRVQTRSANVEPLKVGMLSDAVAGNNVFEAQQNLSKTIGKGVQGFIDYGVQQLEKENERNFLTKEAELKKEINNIAFDPTSDDKGNPKGVLNRKLGQVDSNLTTEYSSRVDEVVNNAGIDLNENSRARLRSSLMNHSEALRDNVVKHQIGQIEQNDKNVYEAGLSSKIDSAILAQSGDTLDPIVKETVALVEKRMTLQGMDAASIKIAKQEAIDKVIGASALARLEEDPYTGRSLLMANKDKVSNAFFQKTLQTLDGKVFELKRSGTYNDIYSGMKLKSGEPDLARMRRNIEADSSFKNRAEKDQMISYVELRANKDNQDRLRGERDTLDQFHNEMLKVKSGGGSVDDALKLIGKYGGDEIDKDTRKDMIEREFKAPKDTDPRAYLEIWEKVRQGGVTKAELADYVKKHDISNSDYKQLGKDLYNKQIDGKANPSFERIKLLADEKYSTKKDMKAKFLYEMKQATKEMKPDEAFAYANDAIEKELVTGSKFFGLFDKKQTKWEVDLEKRDANSAAWGMLQNDIGSREVESIGSAIAKYKQKNVNIDDVDGFIKNIGGYEKVKKGTVPHGAITWLIENNKPLLEENVNALVNKFPDGNFPKVK